MANRSNAFKGSKVRYNRGSKPKYPWHDWMDNHCWTLEQGEDFSSATEVFRSNLHVRARNLTKAAERAGIQGKVCVTSSLKENLADGTKLETGQLSLAFYWISDLQSIPGPIPPEVMCLMASQGVEAAPAPRAERHETICGFVSQELRIGPHTKDPGWTYGDCPECNERKGETQ